MPSGPLENDVLDERDIVSSKSLDETLPNEKTGKASVILNIADIKSS